jgi:hypothetical protein
LRRTSAAWPSALRAHQLEAADDNHEDENRQGADEEEMPSQQTEGLRRLEKQALSKRLETRALKRVEYTASSDRTMAPRYRLETATLKPSRRPIQGAARQPTPPNRRQAS